MVAVLGLTLGERLLILKALASWIPDDEREADHKASLVEQFLADVAELRR